MNANRVKMNQTTSPRETSAYQTKAEIAELERMIGQLTVFKSLTAAGKRQLKQFQARLAELREETAE